MKEKKHSLEQTPAAQGNKTVVSTIKPMRTFVSDLVDLKREGNLDEETIRKLSDKIQESVHRKEESTIPPQSKTVVFKPEGEETTSEEDLSGKDAPAAEVEAPPDTAPPKPEAQEDAAPPKPE
ncbi:MAG: hypothetical protein ACLFNN_03045, partial [Candidatus Paceibacterota bacterium]